MLTCDVFVWAGYSLEVGFGVCAVVLACWQHGLCVRFGENRRKGRVAYLCQGGTTLEQVKLCTLKYMTLVLM